jgi:predicted outer membrane protein
MCAIVATDPGQTSAVAVSSGAGNGDAAAPSQRGAGHVGCSGPGMRVHVLLCIAILGGCASDDHSASDSNSAGDTGAADDPGAGSDRTTAGDRQARALELGNTRGRGLVALARGELLLSSSSDWLAKTFAIVAAANAGEIAQAEFMLSVSSNADVRGLASEIKADHQANELMLEALMQSHGAAPLDNGVTRTVQAEADAGITRLMADASTVRDLDYVEMQITMHQEAILLLSDMRDYPDPPDVRAFLASTLTAVEAHLAHAESTLHSLR